MCCSVIAERRLAAGPLQSWLTMTSDTPTTALDIAQTVFEAKPGRTFDRAVQEFVHVLRTVPDGAPVEISGGNAGFNFGERVMRMRGASPGGPGGGRGRAGWGPVVPRRLSPVGGPPGGSRGRLGVYVEWERRPPGGPRGGCRRDRPLATSLRGSLISVCVRVNPPSCRRSDAEFPSNQIFPTR